MRHLLAALACTVLLLQPAIHANAQDADTEAAALWWPGLKDAIENLTATVGTLDGTVGGLSGETANLKEEVNSLKQQVGGLKGQVENLTKALTAADGLNAQVAALKGAIDDQDKLKDQIKALADKIEAMPTAFTVKYPNGREPHAGHVFVDQTVCTGNDRMHQGLFEPKHRALMDFGCRADRAQEICFANGYDAIAKTLQETSGTRRSAAPVKGNRMLCVGLTAM